MALSSEERVRAAKTESLFRDVNEQVKEIANETSGDAEHVGEFVCECRDESCLERLALTLREYNKLRSVPTHFAIVKGHDLGEVGVVWEENERFTVVEKIGTAGAVAVRLDPRSRRQRWERPSLSP